MIDDLGVLCPFQQYFSYIGTMERWTGKVLCNEVPFRFGKNRAFRMIRYPWHMVTFSACRRGWWKYPRTWQYSKQWRWSLWRIWRQQLNTEFVSPSCWQQMSQNMTQQSGICALRKLISAWASAQYDQGLCYPHGETLYVIHMEKHWVISYPLRVQWRHWSDCADAQADLSLRWAAHAILLVLSCCGSNVYYLWLD